MIPSPLLALALAIAAAHAQDCVAPPPAADFSLKDFSGAWYEIARIQTAGGAALQDWCACTQLIYSATPSGAYGDLTTLNSCRFLTPTGFFLNATSYLANMTRSDPGHWLERYCPECPAASYNIILDGVDARGVPYAVEVRGVFFWLHPPLEALPSALPSLLPTLLPIARPTFSHAVRLLEQCNFWKQL
jgi:hypothetical protein